MTVRVVVQPVVEPISLDEAKEHLRFDSSLGTYQDALISGIISAVRIYAENYTRRALIQQTMEYTCEYFPDEFVLPYPNLLSVESLKYKDSDGVLQTLGADQYQVDYNSVPGRIKPAYGETWPTLTRLGDYNSVQVRYIAGYAAVGSPTDAAALRAGVPEVVKQWMKIRLSNYHALPSSIVVGTISSSLPRDFCDALLDSICVSIF